MPQPLLALILFLIVLLLLIVATEILHRRMGWPAEASRKFLHVSGGIMCLFFPSFFPNHWWLLPLAASSFLLLLITYHRRLLPSVHQTKRSSIGSIIFPLPVYGCFFIAGQMQNDLYYYLPVALLTIADAAAETGGNVWSRRTRHFFGGQKTLAGSLSFLACAAVINYICLRVIADWPPDRYLPVGALITVCATFTEMFTLKGWDNLTVPLVVTLLLLLFA